MTFEMATAVVLALFKIRKLSDDKYLTFIMTHFLLTMPYQWFGIIQANMIGRSLMCTTVTGAQGFILFYVIR